MQRRDLFLWGATGFTGRLVAERLAREIPSGITWAIGGRDRARLETLRDAIGSGVDIVTGDSHDPASMDAIAAGSRVVISTVGPYALHGTPLVEACVRHGTDYCDITGEPQWIRANIDRLHDRATETGARIVHCCGFDSIPSDLGVWMLHDELQRKHGRRLARARFCLRKSRGGFSGGTVASIFNLLEQAAGDPEIRRVLGHPYSLNPENERQGPDRGDLRRARHDTELDTWTAPFLMAAINTRIVRRTNALLGYPYGRDFRYDETMNAGGRVRAHTIALGSKGMTLSALFSPTRWLMRRWLPRPGDGPSKEDREAGFFKILIHGWSDGEPSRRITGTVGGNSDPGYGETSRMLAQSALCLALDGIPRRGGILTPAACMGPALLERLRKAGMTFAVE